METCRCLADTHRLTSVPCYGSPRGLPTVTWGRHLPLTGQWMVPLETTHVGLASAEF